MNFHSRACPRIDRLIGNQYSSTDFAWILSVGHPVTEPSSYSRWITHLSADSPSSHFPSAGLSSAARASHRIRTKDLNHRIDRLSFIAWIVYRWLKPSLLTSTCIFDRQPPSSAQPNRLSQRCSRFIQISQKPLQTPYRPLILHRMDSLSMAEALSTHIYMYFRSSPSIITDRQRLLSSPKIIASALQPNLRRGS